MLLTVVRPRSPLLPADLATSVPDRPFCIAQSIKVSGCSGWLMVATEAVAAHGAVLVRHVLVQVDRLLDLTAVFVRAPAVEQAAVRLTVAATDFDLVVIKPGAGFDLPIVEVVREALVEIQSTDPHCGPFAVLGASGEKERRRLHHG